MNYKIYVLYKTLNNNEKVIMHTFSRHDLAISAANYYKNIYSPINLECIESTVETYFIPLQDYSYLKQW